MSEEEVFHTRARSSDQSSPSQSPTSLKKTKSSQEITHSDDEDEGLVGEEAPEASKTEDPEKEESSQPPLPDEEPPPLPDEEPPEDDGWEPVWDDSHQAFYFYNRFTQVTQWENPRVPSATQPTNHDRIDHKTSKAAPASSRADTEDGVHPAVVGGYNPAIHGSYDHNADYAQYAAAVEETTDPVEEGLDPAIAADYLATGTFNRFTGRFQNSEVQASNFNEENKSRRQMNAFFDVDAAANSHDGRSLRAERAGRKLSKNEVKQFRERRRERKEEKRRAWLRD